MTKESHSIFTENLLPLTSSSQKIQTILPNINKQQLYILSTDVTTYPLNNMDKEKEYDTIKQILINNNYDMKILDKTIQTIIANPTTQHNSPTTITQPRTKWATFMYVGPQTKFITKLFKHTNVNIAFKTNNTLGHILTHNTYSNTNHVAYTHMVQKKP